MEVGGRDMTADSVRDPAEVAALMAALRPGVVINCAADTDVEGAERDPGGSLAANALLSGLLAEACGRTGAVLVHLSSTGCYGTGATHPYVEDDPPEPTTVHHAHK